VGKSIVEFSDSNFKQEVLESKQPVLVDFWAEWCGPCKMLTPTIETLADEFHGKVKFGKLNVDENPQVATNSSVMNIPTLIFFKDGKEVSRVVGINPKNAIAKELQSLL